MSFNFSGHAISKVSKTDITTIETILGYHLTLSKEISFQEAMTFYKNDNEYDIYFGENGALIFTSKPTHLFGIRSYSKDRMITKFDVSETVMLFEVESFVDGEFFRKFSEYNGDTIREKGNKFIDEVETDDGLYIVTSGISQTVGENFWGIKPETKALRYIISL
jgi:hypothetical protein